MKILIISGSPKKRLSSSKYYSQILKFFLTGNDVEIVQLRSVTDYNNILEKLNTIDALVFAFPVYVDAIPSTVLNYLTKLTHDISEKNYHFKVFGINACGFYEGHQCKLTLDMLKNWCSRTNLKWGGGIGIGGSEMLSFIRINIVVGLLFTAIELILKSSSLVTNGNFSFINLFYGYIPTNLLTNTLVFLLFSLGLFICIFRLRTHILKGTYPKILFTTVWFCPRFLFIIFASLYWIFRALIMHGVPLWRLFNRPNGTIKLPNRK